MKKQKPKTQPKKQSQNELKKAYIAKQLGRTNHKNYETYCITRIWHKLDDLDIQIITQQVFKRGNGKIALADLYFPQFKLVVEINENQHLDNEKADSERIEEILRHFAEVADGKLERPIVIRVDDNHDLADINKQVDALVAKIIKMKADMGDEFEKWEIKQTTPEDYIKKGIITIDDKAKFHTISELSHLFGKNYAHMQRCIFSVDRSQNLEVWCPKLRIEKGDYKGLKIDNRFSEDKQYIYEVADRRPVRFWKEALKSQAVRITFPRYRDELGNYSYKFAGVYVIDPDETRRLQKRAWKKVSDYIGLAENLGKYGEDN